MYVLLISVFIFYLTMAILNLIASFFHEFGHYLVGKYICWYKDIKLYLNYPKIFWIQFLFKSNNSIILNKIKTNWFTGYCEFDDIKYNRMKNWLIKEFLFSIAWSINSITVLSIIGFVFYFISNSIETEINSNYILSFSLALYLWIIIGIINEFVYNLNPKGVQHNDINTFLTFYKKKSKLKN